MKIGIIGMGHLGKAVLTGLLRSGVSPEEMTVSARTEKTLEMVRAEYPGVGVTQDNRELVRKTDAVIIIEARKKSGSLIRSIIWALALLRCASISSTRRSRRKYAISDGSLSRAATACKRSGIPRKPVFIIPSRSIPKGTLSSSTSRRIGESSARREPICILIPTECRGK